MLNSFLWRHLSTLSSFTAIMAVQTLLPLVALPWLARILQPEAFGQLLYFCLFPPIVALIIDWGLSLQGVRLCAYKRGEFTELSQIGGKAFSAKILLCSLVIFGAVLFYPFIPSSLRFPCPYLLAIWAGIARGLNPVWFFQGTGVYLSQVASCDVAASLASLASTFLFITTPADWPLYLFFLGFYKSIAYLCMILWLWQKYKIKIDIRGGVNLVISSSPFFGSSLAQLICFNGTQIIFAPWLSSVEIGMLASVTKMIRAFAGIVQPFTQTIFPEACILAQEDKSRSFHLLSWSLLLTFIGMSGATSLLWILKPLVINLALGSAYGEAGKIFGIMLCAVPFMTVNNVLTTQIMASWKLEKIQFYCIAIIACLTLAAACPIVQIWGLTGCAWMPLLTEGGLCTIYSFVVYAFYCKARLTVSQS